MSDPLNLAIRAYTDSLTVHNYEAADRWAAVAFEVWAQLLAEAEAEAT